MDGKAVANADPTLSPHARADASEVIAAVFGIITGKMVIPLLSATEMSVERYAIVVGLAS